VNQNIGGKRKRTIIKRVIAGMLMVLLVGVMTAGNVSADETAAGGDTTVSSSSEAESSETDPSKVESSEAESSQTDPSEAASSETETDSSEAESSESDPSEAESSETDLYESDPSELNNLENTQNAVYLNGKSGDDSADGSTADLAVKTFARAKEIAQSNGNITSIYITDSVSVSGEISLEGTNAVVKRDASFGGYLLVINRGDSAVLKNITIDGNSSEASGTTKSLIYDRGSLTIEDGAVLKNNVLSDLGYFHATGGAIEADEGTIIITGGTIENNTANFGGGIYLYYNSVMTMSGGTIQNNTAVDGTESGLYGYAAGGGIDLYGGSTLNVTGNAEIKNNHSDHMGGGISLGTGVASNGSDVLNMTGGVITGNSSGSGGGGIMVQAGKANAYATANISGGTISDNHMLGTGAGDHAFGGGGIYVNGYSGNSAFHDGVLNLTNALITENTASLEGGGYASCPVSSTEMYLDSGCAIYNNTGDRANDVYILASTMYGVHSGNPYYTVSSTMLGGTPYHWKDEEGNEVPLNHLKGQLNYFSSDYELLLSTDVKQDEAAKGLAKVFITGNTSTTRGGGIGSNRTVNVGQEDTRELTVTKKWETQNALPESITVDLYRTVSGSDETPVLIGSETIKPDEDGNWNLTFINLPKQDNSGRTYEYSVKEETPDAFVSEVEGSMDDGFTIINRDRKVTGSLKLIKVSNGHATPDDAEFTITGPDNYQKVVKYSEFENGSITLDDLAEGTYTVKESNADVSGYSLTVTGSDSAEVTSDSETPAEITLTNQYVPDDKTEKHEEKKTGSLKLIKVSNGHATPDDAEFTITGPDNYQKVVKYSEFENGSITLDDLAEGTYTVKESNADVSGYTLTVTGSDSAEVKSDSETPAEITLTNQYVPDSKTEKVESNTENGGGETEKADSKTVPSELPKTGDTTNLSFYILTLAAAGVILAIILRYRKKEELSSRKKE
jgi:LPXTG-motif cell wall-anchored protein